MHLIDIPLIMLLALFMPLLVRYTLDRAIFSANVRQLAVLGAWVWLLYAVFNESISGSVVGIWYSDDVQHEIMARALVNNMDRGRWDLVFAHMGLGNEAWQLYLAFLYAFMGVSKTFSRCVNMTFAFWGGLILVRELVRILPKGAQISYWPLLIIFFPSVVYWCTWNLKEGFVYWSICLIFSGVKTEKLTLGDLFRVGAGILVGGLLRPHIIAGWVVAVGAVNLLTRGRRAVALLILIIAPAALTLVLSHLQVGSVSVEQAFQRGFDHAAAIAADKRGSDIDFGPGGPILFVSGFQSLFFRPYLWEVSSLRILLSAAEIWLTTLFMLWVWLSMNNHQRIFFLKMPQMRAAILACAFFCLFFSFTANEGLLVRQRIQAVPALLTLVLVPYLYRRAIVERVRNSRAIRRVHDSLPRRIRNHGFHIDPRGRTSSQMHDHTA